MVKKGGSIERYIQFCHPGDRKGCFATLHSRLAIPRRNSSGLTVKRRNEWTVDPVCGVQSHLFRDTVALGE